MQMIHVGMHDLETWKQHKSSTARLLWKNIPSVAMSTANLKTQVFIFWNVVSVLQYVDEKVQPFNKRMNGHTSDIKCLFV